MSIEADGCSEADDWERRQKHAAFYQGTLTSVQQAATGFFTSAALLITLGVAMMKMSGMKAGQDWFALLAGVVGWLVITFLMRATFGPVAERINVAYLAEHAELFPGRTPYRLESYLLPRLQGPRS